MPTSVNLKCPHRGCGLPLRVVRVDDKTVKFKCRKDHERSYTKKYLQRFLSPENVRGDLPQECPKCYTPICVRDRVAQNDAKKRGRVECSVCGTTWVYDPNTRTWIIEECEVGS